uniref:Large ribosomal subunit protein uL3m n=1 Tax=Aceria tosichella TaxID=561515 RepID=A0A6G1SA47_9ACAR
MFRYCASSLFATLSHHHHQPLSQLNTTTNVISRLAAGGAANGKSGPGNSQCIRSLFTSPTLLAKTRKRRKRYPFFWLQDKYKAYYDENLTKGNEEFFQAFLKEKYPLAAGSSPLRKEPWDTSEQFTEGTQRIGLIAKKLGTFPQWLNTGRRILTTCLMVTDNHVIKYHSPEEYAEIGRPVDRKRYAGLGCAIVGADSRDPRQFTAEYNGLFNESGIMPKKKLSRFFITHNARIEPGTPLVVSHFRPGMFVDIYGKTIDHGRVSLRKRYRLKLGQKSHGATKSHNRIGSIGRGRKWCGPLKGRRMPGVMGAERRIAPGLKVWRINTKYNLIFVSGPGVPGEIGSYVNIMDSRMPKKTLGELKVTPPFPTATLEEQQKLDEELFDKDLHKPHEPSIVFEITEEEKKAAALAARKFGKAKTAQKLR